jgi:hypothetical protein
MIVDELIHFEGKLPTEIKIEDKTAKSKFKDFFQKNVAAL